MSPSYREFKAIPEGVTTVVWDGTRIVSGDGPLKWSAATPVPAIGDEVEINFNKFGRVKVTGYFAEGGWFGILAKVLNPPAWWVKQHDGEAPEQACFFGADIKGGIDA